MIVKIKGRENSRIDKYPDAVVMGFPKCGTGTLNFLGKNNLIKTKLYDYYIFLIAFNKKIYSRLSFKICLPVRGT